MTKLCRIYRPRLVGFDPPGIDPVLEGEGHFEHYEGQSRFVPAISRRAFLGAAALSPFLIPTAALAATQFLWGPGTSNNGLLATALTLLTTEMNSLATGNTALSSVGGSSGKFTNSNTAQGMIGRLFLTLGTIGTALTAGAAASIWWIPSYDGTHFETTVSNASQARSPDAVIALPSTTITAANIYASAPTFIEALEFYTFLQNNTGQTFASSANTLALAPFSMQY
jgi:hypothetical protein